MNLSDALNNPPQPTPDKVDTSRFTEQEFTERQAWVDERQARFTANCKVCNGTGLVDHRVMESTLVMPFRCGACDKRNELGLVAEVYWRNVPSEYRFGTFSTLVPSDKSSLR